jgi:hypothetical protein
LKIGQQLEEIAEQVGGTINSNPLTVLNILSIHNKKVADLLDMVPDDANPNHPLFKQYKQDGEGLLKMLVS